ncbi:MAG: DEAD/DEAH box helicase family protein, partial [Planctomycetota bacterium]
MALPLKQYQQNSLSTLTEYLKRARELKDPDVAFYEITRRQYRPLSAFRGPYVCLRVPTGGGKTIMAAHSIGIVTREYLNAERALGLWLAPSTTIVEQTRNALKDRNHPYRQALEMNCTGPVSVMTMEEALYVTRATLETETVIIVCTLQTLRVDDTEGRRIYRESGNLTHHFDRVPEEELQRLGLTDKVNRHTLANVLRLRAPIIIMDEAHNARTPLSFDSVQRFGPKCILEFTATPDQTVSPSNILHHVSAAELKAEEMIKLPIRLQSIAEWKQAIADAVAKQGALEKLTKEEEKTTGEYIRPIVLLQAQQRSASEDRITADVVVKCLEEDCKIPRDQVAVETGDSHELDGVDIFSRACPIRYIVTVQKLKEGWDCAFAYVLCSVHNLSSRQAVEQILGRILRMPRAKKKTHSDLNLAYAFATSSDFTAAAQNLYDALVEAGFDKFEAKLMVEREREQPSLPLFDPAVQQSAASAVVDEAPVLDAIPADLRDRFSFDTATNTLKYTGPAPTEEDEQRALSAITSPKARAAVKKVVRKAAGRDASPAALGETLEVPRLGIWVQGNLEVFEEQFRDFEWKLSQCDAKLSEAEFSCAEQVDRVAVVDVNDQGKLYQAFVNELEQQLSLLELHGPATPGDLAVWLDRQFPHVDVTQLECQLFLAAVIRHLTDEREVPFEKLVQHRFRLREAVRRKIDDHRVLAIRNAYQTCLFTDQ